MSERNRTSELTSVATLYQSLLGLSVHLPPELLLGMVEGRVSARERSRIEAHVAGCSRCRTDLDALQRFAEHQPGAPVPTLVITTEPEAAPPALTLTEEPTRVAQETENELETPPSLRLASTTTRSPRPSPSRPSPRPWVPLAFLALNALGLGALWRTYSSRPVPTVSTSSQATPPPPPPAATSALPTDLARFRAAYERELAQERGKNAQLQKKLEALQSKPVAPSPVGKPTPGPGKSPTALRVGTQSAPLFSTGSLRLTELSRHPELRWKPVAGAGRYAVALTDSRDKLIVNTLLRKPEWRIAAALKRGETYRWTVAALDAQNQPLGEPQKGELTIATTETLTRLTEQLQALARELESAGLPRDAALVTERATALQKEATP